MSSAFSAPIAAFQVGNYFVRQYYQVLQQQPDYSHQFYNDASTMIRIDGDKIETATAMLQIHSLVTSLNFMGIEIKSAHSMDSWNSGILVTVSGSTQFKDLKVRRKFLETFFLAPQEKGYFVLNDIFHFVDEEPVLLHPPSLMTHSKYSAQHNMSNSLQEPVADYILGGEVESSEFIQQMHPEETTTAEEYVLPEQQQLSETSKIVEDTVDNCSSIPYPGADDAMLETAPALAAEPVEPVKQTYASILRVAKGLSGSAPTPSASTNKSASVTSDWQQIPQAMPCSSNQGHSAVSTIPDKAFPEVTDEIVTAEEDGSQMILADITKSVYVRNLPTTVAAFEIEQEFKAFGKIKPDGVVVRSRKDIGICYAFVEFEDTSSVQNAVRASSVQIGGRQVHIEERRPNSSSTRGRRGRGRGGYPMEVQPRGRGQFGARSYGRDGEGDPDYSSRPRGNSYHSRGLRSDRGVLRGQTTRSGQSQSDAF